MFGSSLHISGKNKDLLLNSVTSELKANQKMEIIQTNLEDVFIYLMSHSQDNYGV